MFKNALTFRKLSVNELCKCAMLVAITCILSYLSGYLRIGSLSKFNISFIAVYVAGAAFGPWISGAVGALADVVSFLVNPTGAFVPVFTVIEFINGFLFGFILYRQADRQRRFGELLLLTVVCVILQYGVNVIRTYFLAQMYYGGKFTETFVMRLPSTVTMAFIKVAGILAIEPFMTRLTVAIRKIQK